MYKIFYIWRFFVKHFEMPIFHFLCIFSGKLGWKYRYLITQAAFEIGQVAYQYAEYDREYWRKATKDLTYDLYYVQQARSVCQKKLKEFSSLT